MYLTYYIAHVFLDSSRTNKSVENNIPRLLEGEAWNGITIRAEVITGYDVITRVNQQSINYGDPYPMWYYNPQITR